MAVSEEDLCAFLDHLRLRTDASEATWRERVDTLSIALGLRDGEAAFRLGVSEVREWVKTSRAQKTPKDIADAVERLCLRIAEPWEALIIQALDREPDTTDAAVVLDWVDRFVGDEPRTRRGLLHPEEWTTVLARELADAERQLTTGAKRVLVGGQARLPIWFAVGTLLGRTRGYHVGKIQNGALWASTTTPATLPPLDRHTLREPTPTQPLAISIAIAEDPSPDAARHLSSTGTDSGHVRLSLRTGIGSHAITHPEHAWATALALRDEVRRLASEFRPQLIHLFLATPAGLALLLGHVWDRVPDTQTHEDLSHRGYEPAFLIRN